MTKEQKLVKLLYEIYSEMPKGDIESILDIYSIDIIGNATRLFIYEPYPYCGYLSNGAFISPNLLEYSARDLRRVFDWDGQNWVDKDFVVKTELLVN